MLTSPEISKIVGIPERTIRDWQAKGIIPKTPEIAIAVQAVIAHYKNQIEELKSRDNGDEGELYAEKVRLTRAQADKVLLEIQMTEGDLISARETVMAWSNYILACRAKLLVLPSKLAMQLAAIEEVTECEAIIREEIEEALIELGGTDFVERLRPLESDGDGVFASTEIDDQ